MLRFEAILCLLHCFLRAFVKGPARSIGLKARTRANLSERWTISGSTSSPSSEVFPCFRTLICGPGRRAFLQHARFFLGRGSTNISGIRPGLSTRFPNPLQRGPLARSSGVGLRSGLSPVGYIDERFSKVGVPRAFGVILTYEPFRQLP
jgi:hypothetical protein